MSDQDAGALEPAQSEAPPQESGPDPFRWDPDSDYARKYPGGIAEMAKGLEHANQFIGQGRGAAAEPEPEYEYEEEEQNPLGFLPPHVDEQAWGRVAAYASQQPEKAFREVYANREYWGDELVNVLWSYWASQNALEANKFLQQELWQEQEAELMARLGQRLAPIEERTGSELAREVEAELKRIAPAIANDEWGNRIADYLLQTPGDPFYQVSTNPARAAARIRDIAAGMMAADNPGWFAPAQENGAPQAAQPDRRQAARTTNRSTAAKPANDRQSQIRRQFRATLGIPEDAHPS